MRHYQVRDVMTANPMTVTPATPLKNVADILVRGRIGVVPVLTPQGRVAGVVAEGDLLRKEQLQQDPDGRHSMHLLYRTRRDIATAETAGELMDRYPATVPAGTSVAEAARLMDRHQTRFLLATGEDGKLLGVVTARDLLRVFLRPDVAIKAEISQDVLSRYLGTDPALVKVDVTDGVVRLNGELERKSMLAAALRAVRAVDGVIDVESQLGYAIDDISLPRVPVAAAGFSGQSVARGLAQGHSATGPWSLCRAGIPRCALTTGKDPGRTRRNGDLRPRAGRTPLTTQSESATSGGGILPGHRNRTGKGETRMGATVKDVMTSRVVAVRKNAPFKDIATLLTRYRVSAFPVLDDDGTVIGVVSEADLLCKEALIAAMGGQPGRPGQYHDDFARAAAVTAADLMTTPPVTTTPGEPAADAARLMYNAGVKRLPVVSENGHLVGIISRADVLSVYGRPDDEIGEEITKNVILHEFLKGPGCFTVTVKDGIVTLEGPGTVQQGRDDPGRGLASRRGRIGARPPHLRGRNVIP